MLLSITMMIKNEEKYLDKVLNSLRPLMENINSELIILDTGSTDKSIDIAKKYTDKIYYTEWNNNFAEMRNKSISYTKGDWILILDADEELLDCDGLIKFFNSNLHKKYNCASIELKNIHSEDEKSYTIGSILRLFKKYKGFKYEGAIHEQPIYKEPIYNDIALFKHYGYIFIDEEFKQKKLKRNEDILISELKINPQNPYMNYQLSKNFICYDDYEEAIYYMEKSFNLYKDSGLIPTFVQSELARLYLSLNKYNKCEKICLKYIKNDNKNIDIYYYLAKSQIILKKYKEGIENYKRYIFLLDNYDMTTQANSIICDGNTVSLKENVYTDMINAYYKLEMYDEVIKNIEYIKNNKLQKSYFIILMSLYRLDRLKDIIDLYSKSINSEVEKKEFRLNLEKMILCIKQSDRVKVYNILSKLDGNYGLLNEIRLGKKLSTKKYNEIIIKEKEAYYADLIYYAFNQGIDLISVLKRTSKVYIQNYFNYIANYRKDCVLDIYNYLIKRPNTLDINKLSIYSSLSKALLLGGNLKGEKYENLFLMYIVYSYDYLKQVYNTDLKDEELLIFVKDEEDIFILSFIIIQKLKKSYKLEYLKKMKKLLIENQQYKKGIKIIIDRFEDELNENCELEKLKLKYKSIIENAINCENINAATSMIEEYELMFNKENEILNMKSIVALLNNNFNDAEMLLKKSLLLEYNNFDTIFNIGYLKEVLGEMKDAIKFYNKIVANCEDESIIFEAKQKINLITMNYNL